MSYLTPNWGLPDPDTQSDFYAGVATKRFLAWLVDVVIITLLCLMVLPFTAFVGLFFFAGLYMIVSMVYRTVTLARGSATLGMRLMAIEFRTSQGTRFDLPIAAMHVLLYTIMWWIFLLQVISAALVMTTARGQGLHDLLLGTAPINRVSEF